MPSTDTKPELTAKASMDQPVSQPAVYASGLKTISKFTLKQLLHVSVQSPSSGSVLFELAKVIVVKIIK
jgi:hypothetical protein